MHAGSSCCYLLSSRPVIVSQRGDHALAAVQSAASASCEHCGAARLALRVPAGARRLEGAERQRGLGGERSHSEAPSLVRQAFGSLGTSFNMSSWSCASDCCEIGGASPSADSTVRECSMHAAALQKLAQAEQDLWCQQVADIVQCALKWCDYSSLVGPPTGCRTRCTAEPPTVAAVRPSVGTWRHEQSHARPADTHAPHALRDGPQLPQNAGKQCRGPVARTARDAACCPRAAARRLMHHDEGYASRAALPVCWPHRSQVYSCSRGSGHPLQRPPVLLSREIVCGMLVP